MRKRSVFCIALALAAIMAFSGCGLFSKKETAVKEYASATLDGDDGKKVKVTVDISDGWFVEFASGAAYLYDGGKTADQEAEAMGLTLSMDVYEDYVNNYRDQPDYKVEDGVCSFTLEGDGSRYFAFDVGNGVGFLVTVSPENDADAAFARFKVEPYEEK